MIATKDDNTGSMFEQAIGSDEPVQRPAAATQAATQAQGSIGDLLATLADQAVSQAITAQAPKLQNPILQINIPDQAEPTTIDEATHYAFSEVLELAALRMNIYLYGPSGTGKTHLCRQLAKALGLDFSFNSFSEGCTEAHIIGRTLPDENGNWTYKPAPFVHAYEHGGIHLFDEVDAADPNLLLLVNAPIDNGHLSIPFENRVIERHPDFLCIFAGNTIGNGGTREFNGRNPLDGSTKNRFPYSKIEIGFDQALDRRIASQWLEGDQAEEFLTWLWNLRERMQSARIDGPPAARAVRDGAKLIGQGWTTERLQEAFSAGLTEDQKARL